MRHSSTLCLVTLLAAACGGSPSTVKPGDPVVVKKSIITGKARFRSALTHTGIIVTVLGQSTGAAAVADDGSFTIDTLAAGTYAVTAGAPDTVEGTVQAVVVVKEGETATAPDLLLTATGTVSGKAILMPDSGNNVGIQISADGASVITFTAQDGSYHLAGIPVGRHTIFASKSGYNFASATANVEYGKVATAADAFLEAGATGTGTISGAVKYFNRLDHSGIKVEIERSSVSATTDVDGNYVLKGVPSGYVSIVASAEPYQPTRLENLLSLGSGNYRAPEMKLFLGQQRFQGTITASTLRISPDGRFVLFMGTPPAGTGSAQLYLLQTDKPAQQAKLVDPRSQSGFTASYSSDSKYAAYALGGSLYLLPLETGAPLKLADNQALNDPYAFSTDGKSFAFIGSTEAPNSTRPLMLVTLANQQATRVDDAIKTPLASAMSCPVNFGSSAPFRFSPDGQSLAYVGFTVGGNPEPRVYRNGNTVNLSGDPSCLVFTPDSQRLVWAQRNPLSYTYEAWSHDPAGKPVMLGSSTSASYLTMSADVQWVMVQTYISYYSGSDYTAYPTAGGPSNKFLTKATIQKQSPAGSAVLAYDPATLAYSIADPASATRVPLTAGISTSSAQFSPRGGFFVYPVYKSPNYTNNFANLATGANVSVGLSNYPSYSSSYFFAPNDSVYVYSTEKSELSLASTATGVATRISTGTGTPLAFTPSASHLLYRASDNSLRIFDVQSKAERALNVKSYSAVVRLSSDGSRADFTDDKKDLYSVIVAGGEPLLIDNQIDSAMEADALGKKLLYVVSSTARAGLYFAQVP